MTLRDSGSVRTAGILPASLRPRRPRSGIMQVPICHSERSGESWLNRASRCATEILRCSQNDIISTLQCFWTFTTGELQSHERSGGQAFLPVIFSPAQPDKNVWPPETRDFAVFLGLHNGVIDEHQLVVLECRFQTHGRKIRRSPFEVPIRKDECIRPSSSVFSIGFFRYPGLHRRWSIETACDLMP
jgi:hypothetical protein